MSTPTQNQRVNTEIKNTDREVYGLMDITALNSRLWFLNNGHTLRTNHPVYGIVTLRMNPQQNVISIYDASGGIFTSISAESFLIWGYGKWEVVDPVEDKKQQRIKELEEELKLLKGE